MSTIPIAWAKCRACGKEYDEGNAQASFHHRNRECRGTLDTAARSYRRAMGINHAEDDAAAPAPVPSLADRVGDLRAWARSRITRCLAEETKFAGAWSIGKGHGPPQALVEAWQERRTLEAVLRMLDGDAVPDQSKDQKERTE